MLEHKIKEYVKIYNYTLDQDALLRAVKFFYSPWSDPENITTIRQGYIDVSSLLFHFESHLNDHFLF